MKLGDVSVSHVDIMIKAMIKLDYNIDDILQKFSLNTTSLASPDARVSIPKFMRLGHACIKKSQIPWFGLIMGQVTSLTNLGVAGLLAFSSQNIKHACQQLSKYEALTAFNARGKSSFQIQRGSDPQLHTHKGKGILEFYSISPYNDYNYFVVDSVMSGWYQILQHLSGREGAVEKVCFEFSAPAYEQKYKDYFNCDVLFAQPNNYMVIKKEALTWPCVNHCISTFELLKRQADADLEKVYLGYSFHEKVSHVISPLLNGTTPTLEQVAKQLNMAPWTVRRKLVEEGGSFQQTLNNTRRDLSVSYVCDTQLTLGEIAYLLGFGSPAAFQRAFKRWTGEAPGRFRESARHKPTRPTSKTSSS